MCLATQCAHVLYALLLFVLCVNLSHERATPGESAHEWPGFQQKHAASFLCNREECGNEGLVTNIDQGRAGAGTEPGILQEGRPHEAEDWAKSRTPLHPGIAFTSQPSVPGRSLVAKLKDLVVSVGELEPSFSPFVYDYDVSVPAHASSIQVTVVLPKQDEENYVVKLEGIPLASGIESPPLEIRDHDDEKATFRITVSALAYHPSVYTIYVARELESEPSGVVRILLFVLTGVLLVAVVVFLAYSVYLCVLSGRERGWWPFRYPLREPTPTEYTPIAEAAGADSETPSKSGASELGHSTT